MFSKCEPAASAAGASSPRHHDRGPRRAPALGAGGSGGPRSRCVSRHDIADEDDEEDERRSGRRRRRRGAAAKEEALLASPRRRRRCGRRCGRFTQQASVVDVARVQRRQPEGDATGYWRRGSCRRASSLTTRARARRTWRRRRRRRAARRAARSGGGGRCSDGGGDVGGLPLYHALEGRGGSPRAYAAAAPTAAPRLLSGQARRGCRRRG